MKHLLFIFIILTLLSCSKLEDFTVSDCISRNCPYGLSAISYDSEGNLVVDFGTSDLCSTQYWGDIKIRNDSLILIAKKNFTGANCRCGYVLTYTIKDVVDTCDLKIGFEKDYANFVKRVWRRGRKIEYERDMSDRKSDKYYNRMILLSSRTFHKNWKKRREFRNELKDDNKPRKEKKTNKLKAPLDDVYQ